MKKNTWNGPNWATIMPRPTVTTWGRILDNEVVMRLIESSGPGSFMSRFVPPKAGSVNPWDNEVNMKNLTKNNSFLFSLTWIWGKSWYHRSKDWRVCKLWEIKITGLKPGMTILELERSLDWDLDWNLEIGIFNHV